ncbi:hypothetical protein GQ457_02G028090 [Hibiscus cannabinus]
MTMKNPPFMFYVTTMKLRVFDSNSSHQLFYPHWIQDDYVFNVVALYQLISGFQKAIGIMQPLEAEFWVILIGFQFTWEQGFEFVHIYSDCVEYGRGQANMPPSSSGLGHLSFKEVLTND